jgi:hypothetical protein
MQEKLTEFFNETSAKIDMFGTQVRINFKGSSTVTSKLGGLITLLTVGLGAAYLYTLVIRLWHMQDPKIN